MLPKEVWSLSKYGTINLHASLLPNYRGAAPINWAIINGETKTGVTTFLIDEKIDTGKIILQKEIEILNNDTAETLHNKIMEQGADLLLETIQLIKDKKIDAVEQEKFINNQMQLKHAPKIFKEDCKIDWSKTSIEIYNFIRGLSPIPCAWTNLKTENKTIVIKIIEGTYLQFNHNNEFGSVEFDKKTLKIACSNGYYLPKIIKAEGKKQMTTEEFMRGFKLNQANFF
jgi:methionyl-tRNA formyltransferase